MFKKLLLLLPALLLWHTASATITFPAASGVEHCSSLTVPAQCFFDITTLTSSATSLPYQEVDCVWDFGDSGSGNWSYGGGQTSRNVATGQIVAHIYETASTFTPKVTCNDGTPNQVLTLPSITTIAQDTTWAGNKTVCFYNATVGSGCPSGAIQQAETDLGTAITFAQTACNGTSSACSRILFKGGDAFTFSAGLTTISNAGPGLFSSYGTGKAILSTSTDNVTGPAFSASDWRITNLTITGSGGTAECVSGNVISGLVLGSGGSGATQTTVDNVDVSKFGMQFDFQGNGTTGADRTVIINSTASNIAGDGTGSCYGGYGGTSVGGAYLALLGDSWSLGSNASLGTTHVLRVQPTCRYCIISNSHFDNGQIGIDVIKLDAHVHTTASDDSSYIEISDNRFVSSSPTYIQAQNTISDERLNNIIIERNWWGKSGDTSYTGLVAASSNTTVRNNIFDLRNTSGGGRGIELGQYGTVSTPAPTTNYIYNNTFFTTDTSAAGNYQVIQLCNNGGTTALGTLAAKNNLVYFPNTTSPTFNEDHCGSETLDFQYNTNMTGGGTNAVGTSQTENPSFTNASGTFANDTDFQLQAGSYAKGTGIAVAVYSDYGVSTESSPPNLGVYSPGAAPSDNGHGSFELHNLVMTILAAGALMSAFLFKTGGNRWAHS